MLAGRPLIGLGIRRCLTTASAQQYAFQAEIKQLLQLLSHSLYQSREIAIRELVSNASDALDKMRFVAMTDEAHRETGAAGDRRSRGGPTPSELVIRDNGIGMTRDELVTNLGTIAQSGSLEFLKDATAGGQGRRLADRPVRRRVLLGVHARRLGPGPVAELPRGRRAGSGSRTARAPSPSSRPRGSRGGPRSSSTSRRTPRSSPRTTGSRRS